MNVLFITDEYAPVPSSNGACVSRLVGSVTNGNQAYVLSITGYEMENTHNSTFVTYHRKPASLRNRLIGFCQDDRFVKAIYSSASQIIRQKKIDTVVCVCRPVETMIAGIQLKEAFPYIRLQGYYLDNLFEVQLSSAVKTRIVHFNYRRLFLRFYENAEKIIALKYYRPTFSKLFRDASKVVYVGLPSIQKSAPAPERKGENIRIVYTGSLCREYRNPAPVLAVLSEIIKTHPNIDVVFFSKGCREELEAAKKSMGEHLIIHGLVSFDEAQRQIASADVLLNIANDLPYAVPGKLFEYFSTGKPVLNYCFRADDPAYADYEKYPSCFTLFSYQDNHISRCADFLCGRHGTVQFDDICALYADSTPEYTVNEIIGQGRKEDNHV